MNWNNLLLEKPSTRYITAVVLAIAAQIVRLPLDPTVLPFITYAPFVVAGALLGGLGPGLLSTILCALEIAYFSIDPVGSFRIANSVNWIGFGAFAMTGVVASVSAEWIRRTGERLAEVTRKTISILESISDGFNAFDRQWRYTYVNGPGAKMVGKTPSELLGKCVWTVFPEAKDSPFGLAYRRAVEDNVQVGVEAFYAPLNTWFEVRCYPSPEGLALLFSDTTGRRRAQEQLRLLESVVLQTTDGVLIVEVAGETSCCQRPVFLNPAFERMTGYCLEDLLDGASALLNRAGNDPHSIDPREDGFRRNCPRHLQQPTRRKDGSEFWAEWIFRPLVNKDGHFTHCVWICRDVTERKQAEEISHLLSSIVESSNDAIISKSLDGIITSWNRGAERIYGYSRDEIVGRPISILVPPDRSDEYPEMMEYLKLGELIEHLETERVRKDGQRIAVSLTLSPIKDASNKLSGASIIARDISDRKRGEQALRLSEERYRSLAIVTSQIVWTTSGQGDVVDDSAMWCEFTGQSLEEIRGSKWLDALHPDDRQRTAEIWSTAVNSSSFFFAEYRLRRHDGEYRWMSMHGVPVFEEKGAIREWVSTCADITDRKLAEEEIHRLNQDLERRVTERTAEWEASNKELEAFAYSVSHDLRAPLRAVDGFSRILLDDYAPLLPPEAQHYLQITRNNALQMGNLIDGLLAFSRLTRQPLSKNCVDVTELVKQVVKALRAEREGRQVEITVGDLPNCHGDAQLLKQVFVNLLSNSHKYTRTRDIARIEIGATRLGILARQKPENAPREIAEDSVVYYVQDNGVGFDMRYRDKLFGVFQRLHSAEEFEGTGVGLATVQRIVQRHGGRVWADAEVNQGATFYLILGEGAEHGAGQISEPRSAAEPESILG